MFLYQKFSLVLFKRTPLVHFSKWLALNPSLVKSSSKDSQFLLLKTPKAQTYSSWRPLEASHYFLLKTPTCSSYLFLLKTRTCSSWRFVLVPLEDSYLFLLDAPIYPSWKLQFVPLPKAFARSSSVSLTCPIRPALADLWKFAQQTQQLLII